LFYAISIYYVQHYVNVFFIFSKYLVILYILDEIKTKIFLLAPHSYSIFTEILFVSDLQKI